MCLFFLLSLLETEEGGEWGAGGPVAGVLGLGGGRGEGRRGRTARGVDSPPQFHRRGPAGRGATAMAAAGRRLPWRREQGWPGAGIRGGKGRGR